MSALDLDAIQARAQRVKDWRWKTPEIGMGKLWAAVEESQDDIPKLVTELRAARKVQDEISRLYEEDRILLDENERLLHLLDVWDRLTTDGEVTDASRP